MDNTNNVVVEVPPTEWEHTINTFMKNQETVLGEFIKSQKNFLEQLGNDKKRKRSDNEETLDLNTSGSLVANNGDSDDGRDSYWEQGVA